MTRPHVDLEELRKRLVPARLGEEAAWRTDLQHVHPLVQLPGASRRWVTVYGGIPGTREPRVLTVAKGVLDSIDHTTRECLLFAVADPLTPLITIALSAHRNVCSAEHDVVSLLLCEFQRQVQGFEATLTVRPGLQVVFVGDVGDVGDDDKLLMGMRAQFQTALRRVGTLAPDFDVRWVQPSDDWIGCALRAHVPDITALVPGIAGRPEPGELARVLRAVQGADNQDKAGGKAGDLGDRVPAMPFEGIDAGRRLQELLELLDRALPKPFGARLKVPALASAGMSVLSAYVAARRFAGHPVEISLSPVTLVSSENASGKTTLAEALCQLYQQRPRLRFRLPAGSNEWQGSSNKPPWIAALRLCGDGGTGGPAVAESLFLFADDADLLGGGAGDSAAVAWWPLNDPLRNEVVTALSVLTDLVQQVALWTEDRETRVDLVAQVPIGAGDDVSLEPDVRARVVEILRDAEAEMDDDGSPPSAVTGAAARLQEHGVIGIDLLAQVAWPKLAEVLLRAGPTAETWAVLAQLGPAFQLRPDLLEPVVRVLLGRMSDQLGTRLDRLARSLERLVVSEAGQKLERELADYLDPDLDPPSPRAGAPSPVRANTSRLVREGMARRLARWSASGGGAPAMMIDEPVFGHDPPSAARVVIRLLRWRRRQESLRWFEHAILGQGVALRLVVDRESPVGTTQPTQPPNVVVNPDPRATVAPVPVQLVIASHQPHALEIAAELEGTELDHDLRAALRELVPAQWRSRVRDALQNCRERLTEFEATTELPACIPYALPSQGLRALWRIPDSVLPADSNKEDDSKDKEDWGQWKAVATLERLGLHHLADRLKESVEHDGPARAARRLLTWLVWNDLLIAAFEGAEHGFDLGGVSLRELSANGGVAYEIGPTRLRRIGAMLEVLPPLAVTEAGTEPASHLVPEPRSALAVPEPGVPQPAREAPQVSPPVPDASEASPPVRDAPEASPPVRNAPSLGIWRVAIVGADGSLREEIPRRAGALRPHAGEAADLLVHLDASSSGYRFRAEDGSFSGGATKDDWRDGEPLARAIAYRRAEHLASHQPEEREVEVLVWTHGDDPVPSPNLAFSVGARLPDPPLLDSRVMEIWRTRIDAPLVRLRDALGRSAKTRWLKFWPLCTPGAAIRIGSLFHHQSRFSVICDQAGAVWDLDRQPTPPTSAPALSIQPFGADDDAREEVHLLIGMSAAVYDRYRAWQQGSTGMKPARALVVEPIGGPSRTSVPAGMVVDWAEYVFRPTRSLVAAVRARRAHTQQPPSVDLRIFCAAPTGFAIAFGRSLNATGRIVTMDLVSGTDAYVPTFDFRA